MAVTMIVGTSAGTQSITLPTGIEEDDLILVHWHAAGSFPVEVTGGPAGYELETWFRAGSLPNTFDHTSAPPFPVSNTTHGYCYVRRAVGDESGSSVALSGGTSVRSLCSVVRGVDHDARERPVYAFGPDVRPVGDPLTLPLSLAAGRPFVGFVASNYDSMPLSASAGFAVEDQVSFGTDRIGRVVSDGSARTSVDLFAGNFTVPIALFALAYDDDALPPPGPAVRSPLDRYRSSISADAGSLLATTRAVPFDTSHTIAFSPAAELEQETLYPFYEATSVQSGQPDVLFYPRARQSIDGPIVYDGVTLLTLMERVFPAQILTRTESVSLPALATAQEIITYVFEQWANAFPWFSYKAVPDLRLRSTVVTGDWDGILALRTTRLRDSVIRVRQSATSPRSMRAMLEGLLSPFQGTQFYMDSDGDLVIRPVYGPDADATPFKTLDNHDVVTISIGEPSVDQIRNRATGSFQRYTEADEVSVLQPAFLQVASYYMRDAAFLPGPPVSDYLITPPTDRLDLSTEDAGFGGWRSIPLGDDVIIGDDPIAFEDSGGLLITAAVNTYNSAGTLQEAWTSPGDLTVEVHSTVPLDGTTVLAFTVWRVQGDTTNSYYGRWNARWNATTQAVEIQWAGGGLEVNTFFGAASLRAAQMSITVNGVARAWAEGATISATFGVVDDGDFVPGPDGTNALTASVTAYGVVEERFTIEGYGALSVTQLERIVEAYVIENLTPRATREMALTWKGAVGVEFDDRGRLVGFPGDGEGFLTARQYADDFLADAGGVVVKIEETVPASPGTIDLEAVYLLNESGSFWLNEDGTTSPPA